MQFWSKFWTTIQPQRYVGRKYFEDMKDLLLLHFVPQYVIVYICNKNKNIPD